jgi:hypothetical protein
MHLNLGVLSGNSAEADGCMLIVSPTAGHPFIILNTSCELVHLYLFPYQIRVDKKINFSLPLTLCHICVLKTSMDSTTKRRHYTGTRLKNGVLML